MDKMSLSFGYGLQAIDEKAARESAAYKISSNLYYHHNRPAMTYPTLSYHIWAGDILCFPIYRTEYWDDGDVKYTRCVGEMYCEVIDNIPGKLEIDRSLITKKIKAFSVTPPKIILKAPDGTVFPLINDNAIIENDSRYYGYTFALSSDFSNIIRSYCWCETKDNDSIYCTEATRYSIRLSDERHKLSQAMNLAKDKYRAFWQEQKKRIDEQAQRESILRSPVPQNPSETVSKEDIHELLSSLAKE